MDSAYDSKVIADFILNEGRVPVIEPNKRKDNERAPLNPAKKERYNVRTVVERGYSILKDRLIPRAVYVKGFQKVSFVLLASVVCLAAMKYLLFLIPPSF